MTHLNFMTFNHFLITSVVCSQTLSLLFVHVYGTIQFRTDYSEELCRVECSKSIGWLNLVKKLFAITFSLILKWNLSECKNNECVVEKNEKNVRLLPFLLISFILLCLQLHVEQGNLKPGSIHHIK